MHCGLAAQVPDCVRDAKLAYFSSQSRPAANVPLFHRAASSHNPSSATPQCITVTDNGRVHGVCFNHFETLDRFVVNIHYRSVSEPLVNNKFYYCVRRRRTLSNHVVFSRGIDYVPRVSIAMPVDFRVWTPSWTGTLSLDSIWTGTRSLDSMCHIASISFD